MCLRPCATCTHISSLQNRLGFLRERRTVLRDAAPTAVGRARSDLGARPRVPPPVWSIERIVLMKELKIESHMTALPNVAMEPDAIDLSMADNALHDAFV